MSHYSSEFKAEESKFFEVTSTCGDARTGTMRVNGTELRTPNFLPVVNFYAGGTAKSLYGGGIHRTMKEFMVEHDRIGGGDFGEYFDGMMYSVSSLTDYNITRERYEDYISKPIKQRSEFEDFDGTLFLDSGGFKFLSGQELDGSDFDEQIDQQTVYEIQQAMGGDILINLDRPIAPDDGYRERVEKARLTAENVVEFLELSEGEPEIRFLTLHGYNYAMQDTFLQELDDIVGSDRIRQEFDGIALGGLVPLKDNKGKLISAVQDCREVLADWGFDNLPLHVLGISSSAIPLLAAVGADSFDSSSYLHAAINGKYCKSLLGSQPINTVDFSECECPVCNDPELVSRMRGNAEYQKDILGPVAMHNLIVQKHEIARIREAIAKEGTNGLVSYLEETLGRDVTMRKFAHRVVNESLGGYF